ncbi:MAG: hypothetical protein IPJ19_19185 [Planctomycetes bacterium]|nr:hypothetical protein [Planctomycetota bacterium]
MIAALLAVCLSLGVSSLQQPPEVIDRRPNTSPEVLQVIELRDLLACIEPDAGSGDGALSNSEVARAARAKAVAYLTDFITHNIVPPLTGAQQSLRITPSGTLVLHGVPAQQEWVQSLLELNRSRENVVLEATTFIEGPKGSFQRMGIAGSATPTVLEAKDLDRFRALGKDDPQFQVIAAPRMLVYPLGASSATVGEFITYVKSWKLETVEPGEVKLPVPQIEHAFHGLELVARTVLLDAQRVVLDLDASNSVVQRPIPTQTVKLDPSITQVLTVATPQIEKKSIQARCTLGPDALVAFSCPVAGKDERELLILVSAHAQKASDLKATPGEVMTTGAKKEPAPEPPK